MNSREAAPDESPWEVMLVSNLLMAAKYLSASSWDSVELLGIALPRIPAWAHGGGRSCHGILDPG